MGTPYESAIRRAMNSDVSRAAILYHLDHARVEPSHDFAHAYEVTHAALEEASRKGMRDTPTLQLVFITAMFHDAVRTSERVSDTEGRKKSAEMAQRFCRKAGIGRDETKIVMRSIIDPASTRIGHVIEFADSIFILQHSRIKGFLYEHPQLREKTPGQVARVYDAKFESKFGALSKSERRRIDAIARGLVLKKQSARAYGRSVFEKGILPERAVKEQFSSAHMERRHGLVDTLSMLALENAQRNPVFAQQIVRVLRRTRTFSPYGGPDRLTKEKITHLRTMITSMPKIISLPQTRRARIRYQIRPR